MEQRYRMEVQKLGPGLVHNQDFDEGGGIEPKVKIFSKMFKLGNVSSNLV